VQDGLNDALKRSLDVGLSQDGLLLAIKELNNENFEVALSKAKEAQLTLILQTKGRVNILWFMKEYWLFLLSGFSLGLIILFILHQRLIVQIISNRIKNLIKEELAIDKIIEHSELEYARNCFPKSSKYYQIYQSRFMNKIKQYELRLKKIKKLKNNLENRRSDIIKLKKELYKIKDQERKTILEIKNAQKAFYEKHNLNSKRFWDIFGKNKRKLQNEYQKERYLRKRLEIDELGKDHKFLVKADEFYYDLKEKLSDMSTKGIKKSRPKELSNKEDVVKKRKEVYKMLKEHGIKVPDYDSD